MQHRIPIGKGGDPEDYIEQTQCPWIQLAHLADPSAQQSSARASRAFFGLQSPLDKLQQTEFSFDIISDPKLELFKELEIVAAPSMEVLVSGTSMAKMDKAIAAGYAHGEYEGDELQLPATFVVDENLKVLYAKYSKDLDDLPTIDDLSSVITEA